MSSDAREACLKIRSTFDGSALKPWDSGPKVAELQVLLNACGCRMRVDGDFGLVTEKAVRAFQRQHGLKIDGIVGAETWPTLEANIRPGARLLKVGHTGADVYGLQELLQAHGHSVPKNGLFDPETEQGVVLFQKHRDLIANGVVDAVTWECLKSCPFAPKPLLLGQRAINLGHWW